MNPPEENDPIDALLREQNPYIEDGGFTARVVKSLPRRRTWLRPAILLGSTAIGFMLAMFWLPWGNLPPLDLTVLFSPNYQVMFPWVVVISVIGSLTWSAIIVLKWEDN